MCLVEVRRKRREREDEKRERERRRKRVFSSSLDLLSLFFFELDLDPPFFSTSLTLSLFPLSPHTQFSVSILKNQNSKLKTTTGRKVPQTRSLLRDAGDAGDEDLHRHPSREESPRGRHGVLIDQSPPRLPDLRPRGGMRPPGPEPALWVRQGPVLGGQARRPGQERGTFGQNGDDEVHPLHSLRPVRHRGGGRAGARDHGARERVGGRDLCGKEKGRERERERERRERERERERGRRTTTTTTTTTAKKEEEKANLFSNSFFYPQLIHQLRTGKGPYLGALGQRHRPLPRR